MAAAKDPFATLAPTSANHFRLYFYAAATQLMATASEHASASEPLQDRLRALAGYGNELRANGVPQLSAAQAPGWWRRAIADWEAGVAGFLPIRAVCGALDLDHDAMTLVFAAGLVEEDSRFAAVIEQLNEVPDQRRPTLGTLDACWRAAAELDGVRTHLRRLEQHGLLHTINTDAPRPHHAFEVPGALWDVLRGDRHDRPAPGLRFRPSSALLATEDLILSAPMRQVLDHVPALLGSGDARTIIIRGPHHNGRRTVLGSIARALDRGVLEVEESVRGDGIVSLLATALHAMPIGACDVAPGERLEVPWAAAFDGPSGIALGRSGAIGGATAERAVTLTLDAPGPQARRALWARALDDPRRDRVAIGAGGHRAPVAGVDAADDGMKAIADRFRLTAGHIHRVAALARAQASLAGVERIDLADVRRSIRLLNVQALDTLATPVPVAGGWADLAARDETLRDLLDLELRCRHRERLPEPHGEGTKGSAACGVRALFRGPSGTGKTLAVRLLASVLQKDLYRVDLSSIVNKYIGETEKNLERVLSRAEELDVVLLFDEGDALLTHRTDVSNATDRYANLEINFLLQRLESFDGILVVTTNAGERIDTAFERRMDVVVEFQVPQAAERWDLWQLHLPRSHVVDPEFVNEVATRCTLGGGQIRNAVAHASLLAVHAGTAIDTAMLDTAVRREYRKAGAVCPLRSASFAATGA